MGWLRSWRINRAAKRYARQLPGRLKQAWGFSEHYTPGQIRTSVKRIGLNADFIAIGFAGFLPKEQYDALRSEMPIPLAYEEALSAFVRYFPIHLWTKEWEPDKSDSTAGGGYDGSD